jgi:hypothetical protein
MTIAEAKVQEVNERIMRERKNQLYAIDSAVLHNIDLLNSRIIPTDKQQLLQMLSELSVQLKANQWQTKGDEAKIRNKYPAALLEKFEHCIQELEIVDSDDPHLKYYKNLLSRNKNNAFFAEGRYWVNNHAHVLDATDKNLLDFIAIVINSMKLDDYITGSAQPKLSQDNLNKIPIVLPPLAEQQRIIAEIKKWFTLIDQIEQDKADLQTTIELTKSKILDLAIHGKLIPQDPINKPPPYCPLSL